jgi:DNA-binding transcriptional regulator GbsR (MarR family)
MNSMNNPSDTQNGLSELEREVIELFVRMADVLNLPRSVGEIYGLLFISSAPLCLDDCRMRLHISKGSTSQGLRILRSFGAIRTVYIPGDRKDYYVAETSLRKMARGFASEQIQPHVSNGKERIEHIRSLADKAGEEDGAVLRAKIDLLENWQKRAGKTLPLVLKLIGG